MAAPAHTRRIVGLALMASAAILVLMAILVYTGAFPIDPPARGIVAGAIGVAAFLDALIGLRFLLDASTS